MSCPRKFFYGSVLRLPSPASIATTRGTLAHWVLEHLFDLPRGQRTLEAALALLRPGWQALLDPAPSEAEPEGSWQFQMALRSAEGYRTLAPAGSPGEQEILRLAEQAVRGYFGLEDPNVFDPMHRELLVEAKVAGVDLRGVIDRIDAVVLPDGTTRYYIADYKSSAKVPDDKYLFKAFFGLRLYALIAYEVLGIKTYALRLVYPVPGQTRMLTITPEVLHSTRTEISTIWSNIRVAAKTGRFAPKRGPLCSYCSYQEICPLFAPQLPVAED